MNPYKANRKYARKGFKGEMKTKLALVLNKLLLILLSFLLLLLLHIKSSKIYWIDQKWLEAA